MNNRIGISNYDLKGVIAYAIQQGDAAIWAPLVASDASVGIRSRDIFTYLLALFEGDNNALAQKRAGLLLDKALQMQMQGADGLWNFQWVSTKHKISDPNAVEFCMCGAVLLWQHRDKMLKKDVEKLTLMMDRSADTCLAQNIPVKYTNIALMNTMNLILLGEALDRPEIADAGYARLDQICVYTWEWGIHEYTSPTYTGIQLYCIMFAQKFCQSKRAQLQLECVMIYLLTLIAQDRGSSMNPVMGANSRKVEDYTTPHHSLDNTLNYMLWAIGWWTDPFEHPIDMYWIYAGLAAHWLTQATFFTALVDQYKVSNVYPRSVQYVWGPVQRQSKTHWVWSDVSLSCAGAGYDYPNNQDMPLTVDFPCLLNVSGGEHAINNLTLSDNFRAYFVSQFNGDFCGLKGSHHFAPFFWGGAQSEKDALGVAFFNNTTHIDLKSYFVLPKNLDEIWVNDQLVYPVPTGGSTSINLAKNDVVMCRVGAVYVGVRIVWMHSWGAGEGVAVLNLDGQAVALTIVYDAPEIVNEAGVALWVRVGSGLDMPGADLGWRDAFQKATVETAQATMDNGIIQNFEFAVQGEQEMLRIEGVRTYEDVFATHVSPKWSQDLLVVNGDSIADTVFASMEPIQSYLKAQDALKVIPVSDQPVYWYAADGFVTPPLGKVNVTNVWFPAPLDSDKNDVGSVTWRFDIAQEGSFYLWGSASTPGVNSPPFVVRIFNDKHEHFAHRLPWFAPSNLIDTWCPFTPFNHGEPQPIVLPKGPVYVQVFIRTPCAQLSQMCLASRGDYVPIVTLKSDPFQFHGDDGDATVS